MIGSLAQNRPDPRGGVLVRQRQGPELVRVLHVTSVEELRAASAQLKGVQIDDGARGQVRVDGLGYGLLARAAGMEQLFGSKLVPVGARVLDVDGDGLNVAVVDFDVPRGVAQQSWIAPQGFAILIPLLIVALIAALSLAGMFLFRALALFIEKLGKAALPIAGLVIVVIGGILLLSRRGTTRSGSP